MSPSPYQSPKAQAFPTLWHRERHTGSLPEQATPLAAAMSLEVLVLCNMSGCWLIASCYPFHQMDHKYFRLPGAWVSGYQ